MGTLFQAPTVVANLPGAIGTSVAIGDLSGDKTGDIALGTGDIDFANAGGAAGTGGPTDSGSLTVFISAKAGNFSAPVRYPEATFSWIGLGDLDTDGHQDVVIAGRNSGYYVSSLSTRLNQGTGALGPLSTFSVGRAFRGPALGDLDGDDKPEIVVPDFGGDMPEQGRIWVLKATSNGSFVAKDYDVGVAFGSVALGDLNGDGKADIAASAQDGVHVLLNDGSGQFPTVAKYVAFGDVTLADLDGDGKTDIVSGSSVMFNIGSGTFAVAKSLDIDSYVLQLADLNGDGKVDAAAASYTCAGITLYLNDGKGNLRPSYRLPDKVQSSFALGDVSGDGSPDLVIVNGSTLSVRLHQ